jgi:nucleotide-binding universal stress UspA family protein
MSEFRRICCPIDFSERSRIALETAARMVRRDGGGLTVLHVTETAWPGAQGAFAPPPRSGQAGVTAQLAAWTAEAERLAGGTVSSVLLSAPVAEAIAGFARDDASDLIVMSSHGRTGFRRLVLGSVADAVVRTAPCPVLLVRRDEPAAPADTGETGGMPA